MGRGSRRGRRSPFGGDVAKQYAELDGQPLVARALQALLAHPSVEGAVVVLAADDAAWPGWSELCGKPVLACVGGATRAESVLAGLAALPESVRADDFVLVHDAARPNLHPDDLDALLERGRADPVGAILAAPVRDTLKRAGDDGGIDRTEPRERLWRAFTPQLFRRLQLSRALEAARGTASRSPTNRWRWNGRGLRPLLVEGREDNLKVTTPADLALLRALRA